MRDRATVPFRWIAVVGVNVALFAALFLLLEVGTRIARAGFRTTILGGAGALAVPYSRVASGQWVIGDPELGYRLNPEHPGVNALSLRHGTVAIPKPPGLSRVVVLGDSIPWDSPGFVDELIDRLRARPTVEVINASVPGYTTHQERLFFERYVAQTTPDLVVWTYCLNDNHRFLHVFDEQARMLVTQEAKDSLRIRSPWDRVVARSYVLSSIRLGLLARRESSSPKAREFPWEASAAFNTAWSDASWPAYEEHLRAMVERLGRAGARLAVVVFPFEPQLIRRKRRDRLEYILKPQTRIADLCAKYGLECLDLFPAFARVYDQGSVLYRDRIHPTPEGHRLTATELLRFLDERELLPRPPRPSPASDDRRVARDAAGPCDAARAAPMFRPWNDA